MHKLKMLVAKFVNLKMCKCEFVRIILLALFVITRSNSLFHLMPCQASYFHAVSAHYLHDLEQNNTATIWNGTTASIQTWSTKTL